MEWSELPCKSISGSKVPASLIKTPAAVSQTSVCCTERQLHPEASNKEGGNSPIRLSGIRERRCRWLGFLAHPGSTQRRRPTTFWMNITHQISRRQNGYRCETSIMIFHSQFLDYHAFSRTLQDLCPRCRLYAEVGDTQIYAQVNRILVFNHKMTAHEVSLYIEGCWYHCV